MSDSGNAVSGFSTAMNGLMSELGKLGNECFYLGWQTYGQPAILNTNPHYVLLPNFGGHAFGRNSLPFHLTHVQPDVLVALGDFFMVGYLVDFPRVVPYVHWFPIDGYPIPSDIENLLRRTDAKVCFSKYALELCTKAGIENVSYIPHGVDHVTYHPDAEGRVKSREAFALHYGIKDIDKKFIVGQVNRNQRRKMFDRWLQTMSIVCGKDPDIIGWLHCDYYEPREAGGWNINYLIERLKLSGRIFQTPGYVNYMYGVSPARMNQIYNSFDIHFSATGGEGFGLSTVESQAAGVPNVITDYTTSKELVEGHGELVRVKEFTICDAGVDRALIDVEDAAEKILKLKADADLRKRHGEQARQHMINEYDWGKIGKAFNEFLKKVVF